MRLDSRHFIPCDPRVFWDLLEDPAFLASSDSLSGVLREILEDTPGAGRDGRRLLRVRWTSQRDLPGVVKRVLGSDHLSYELQQHMDDEAMHLHWHIVPPISPDRFMGGGEFWVEPVPGGCQRRVTGEIEVKLRLVGGRIEKMLAAEISKGHEKGAQAAARWLNSRGPRHS